MERVCDDILSVDDESGSDGSNTEPFHVDEEDLRLGYVERNGGWTGSVQLVSVPRGLCHIGMCHRARDVRSFANVQLIGQLQKVAVVTVVVPHLLTKVS